MAPKRTRPATTEQEVFARVLAAWAGDGESRPAARGALSAYLDKYNVQQSDALRGLLRRTPLPFNLSQMDIWIVGAPVDRGTTALFPVATAALRPDGDGIIATIRVALLQESRRFGATVTGWRFESAERPEPETDGPPVAREKAESGGAGQLKAPPHRYPHAQAVSGWHTSAACLLHPHPPGDDVADCRPFGIARDDQPALNETRPAFPLRGRTLPGLVAAALTTLYGPDRTRQMLGTDQNLVQAPEHIRDDFADILGE